MKEKNKWKMNEWITEYENLMKEKKKEKWKNEWLNK